MKRKFSLLLILLALLTVLPANAAAAANNNNDTKAKATKITRGSTVSGTLAQSTTIMINGSYQTINNYIDYYTFTLDRKNNIAINLSSSSSRASQMTMTLMDEEENTLNIKYGDSYIVRTLEPGTYYVTTEYYGSGYIVDYTLTLDYCPHDQVVSERVQPTCTAQGYTLYFCGNCNLSWEDNYVSPRHSYGSWTTITAPTCTKRGTQKAVCTICGTTTYNYPSALGHKVTTWAVTTPQTCTNDGTESGICINCNVTQTRKLSATGHAYGDWITTEEPTCTKTGTKTQTCGNCGDVQSQTIASLGHQEITAIPAVDPTCTETGLTEGSHCLTCGEILTAQQSIPALGHKEILGAAAVSPTCEETGLTERTDCSVCGAVLIPAETIPALGHTEVKDAAKEPTCSQYGKTEGSHCSVCGKILKAQSTVPTLPHTEVLVPAIEPTCTESGQSKGKYCSVCKTDIIRSLEIPALGHQKVIEVLAVPATCTEGGMSEGYRCSVCGIREVPKATDPIPHNYLNGQCVYCGQSGTGWTWNLSGTTLTISGTGPMTDFADSNSTPWADHRTSIKKVIVEKGITHIGKHSFYGFSAMTSVTLPDSVTTIGPYTFGFCSSLTGITLPKNLTEISDYLFYHSEIRTITIPDSVTRIGNHAFERTSLSSVSMPRNVTSIGEYAFYQCSALKNVSFSSRTSTIGQYAFGWCSYLQYVFLPSSLIELGNHAFYMCEELSSVYMNNGLLRIGDSAFDYCKNLYSVSFTDSITHIGNSAFEDCAKISSIILPANLIAIGDSAFDGCGITNYTLYLPENLVSIGAYAFRGSYFDIIKIPAGLTSIGQGAFAECASLKEIHITDLAAWVTNSYNYCGSLMDGNNYYKKLYLNGELLTKVVIPDGVTSIGKYAFCNCNNITSVTLPDSVAQIGDNAFRYCTNLTSITLPAGVRSLGKSAFAYSGLKTITFQGRAPEPFGTNAFYNRSVTAYYPGQDPSWTSSVRGYYGGTVSWIPSSCTGEHTQAIDSAVAPTCTANGWTEGKRCAVCGFPLVPRESIPAKGHFVLGPDQTLVSPDTMEPGCTEGVVCVVCKEVLKEPLGHRVIIEKPYKVINNSEMPFVLRGDRYYSNTQAAETTSELQFKLNYNCKLTLNYGISSEWYYGSLRILLNDISKDYINGIVEQESLTLNVAAGDTLTVRYRSLGGQEAISDRGWVTVQYAEDQPQIVVPAESLEAGCASIVCDYCQAIVKAAPGHKEVIDPGVAATCSQGGLTEGKHCSVCEEILVPQTETAALGHDFVSGVCSRCGLPGGGDMVAEGECGTNVGWKLYDSGLLLISGKGPMSSYISTSHPWRSHLESITSIVIEAGVTSISSSAFTGFTNLESISIPEGVTSVGNNAFQKCTKLKEVVLPASVTSVDNVMYRGNYMFDGCSSLESVTLPEGITSIGEYMFRNCKKLTAVEIPSTVTEIGSNAFYYCSALKTVTLHEGLTTIDFYAFSNCSALTEIVIPETVTSIGSNAFYYCTALTKANIPNGVTSIPEYTFYNCSALTEIIIPGSVMAIHENAFYYCRALKQITFSGRAPGIGKNAFFLVRATALYPENYGWQEEDLQNYGGTLTWQSYDDGTGGIDPSEDLASGECGTALHWVLAGDGTLTISGNGEMPNYNSYSSLAPWNSYSGWIDQLVIEEGVTSVGNYAFSGCFGLKSVSLSSSVQKIGNYAFQECNNLKEIVIPERVTEIGSCAFSYCYALERVTLPAGLTEISSHTFSLCYALREINIPDSVTTIAASAFYSCDALTEITIPGSVATISNNAFYDCGALKQITFSGSAPTISGNAFQYVKATAWYPAGDASWNSDALQNYGGTLTWKAACSGGHTPVTTPSVAPTCTKTGLEGGTYCSVCEKVLTPQSIVPATGHSYGDPTFEWKKYYPRVTCTLIFPCRNCSTTRSVSCKVTETPTDTVGQVVYTATAVVDGNSYTTQVTDVHHFHTTGTLYSSAKGHWYHCAICQVKLATVSHTPGDPATENTAQKCTVCNYTLQLPLGLEWAQDASGDTLWASGYYGKITEQYGDPLQ